MQVHRGLDHLPEFNNAVLTIGSFDGVHHGHKMIISRLIKKAKEVNGESIILTFNPHPRQVVFPNDDSLRLLSTLDEKIDLLQDSKLDHLVIVPFTIEFSQINPYYYVDEILIARINVKHLIIGYDHKFGLNREGNIDLLNIYAKQEKFTVEEISRQDVDDLHVSSTKIRNHILNGEIERANKLLGASYQLSGIVTRGNQIAGRLGYPTANCEIKDKAKLIPVSGTYAARAVCDGIPYDGMLYIGKSPTLQNRKKDVIEMNLFGIVKKSLYGKKISIFPEKQFRGDQKFDSKKELQYNIAQDKTEVEQYFLSSKSHGDIATAILNYNGKNHLETFLRSHNPSHSHEVIVIDNSSTDDSLSYIDEFHKNVKVIKLEKNEGFAKGYNDGLQEIGHKYVAIVNSDVEVTDNWLTPIIDAMEQNPSIAAAQPKILSFNHKSQFEHAGAAGGFIDSLGYPLCRGRIMSTIEEDQNQYDNRVEVFWTSGAAMVIRNDIFKKSGGFDIDFFAHMEEIDLCWRLKNAGYKLICEPNSIVYHLGGGTLKYDSPEKVFLNLRNNYWMILKNYSITKLLYTIPIRILIDTCYIMLFLIQGRKSHFISSLKGLINGLGGIFRIAKKRRDLTYFQNRYKIGAASKSGIIKAIMPFSYYILGKKKFTNYK